MDYPGIEHWDTDIDVQMMWLVRNPNDCGLLVTSNLFGEFISDLAAQLVGGLGFAPSGNIGDNFGVFEPTRGSAPKDARQYEVNPTGMLLAWKLTLDWPGEIEKAQLLEGAMSHMIAGGKIRVYGMGGDSSTLAMAKAVGKMLEN